MTDGYGCSVGLEGVNGVADDVVEHLANLTVEAKNGSRGPESLCEVNLPVADAAFVDVEHALEEILRRDLDWISELLVKAECLGADSGNAA